MDKRPVVAPTCLPEVPGRTHAFRTGSAGRSVGRIRRSVGVGGCAGRRARRVGRVGGSVGVIEVGAGDVEQWGYCHPRARVQARQSSRATRPGSRSRRVTSASAGIARRGNKAEPAWTLLRHFGGRGHMFSTVSASTSMPSDPSVGRRRRVCGSASTAGWAGWRVGWRRWVGAAGERVGGLLQLPAKALQKSEIASCALSVAVETFRRSPGWRVGGLGRGRAACVGTRAHAPAGGNSRKKRRARRRVGGVRMTRLMRRCSHSRPVFSRQLACTTTHR